MKKNFPIITALLLCVLINIASAEDRRTDSSSLRIMTFNAKFLWDGMAPEEGNQMEFPWKGSPQKAQKHMGDIAEIIIRNNPDILNLVEVENEQALNMLNNDFLYGMGYKAYFVQGKDTFTGQDMALLTRIDPIGYKIFYDGRKPIFNGVAKSVSKNYTAKFNINDTKIALIGFHLLSKPDSNTRKPKREAQANAILSMAMDLQKENFKVILLGDFNDYDGAACCIDQKNSKPITSVLKMLKSMDKEDSTDDLVNIASLIPQKERYTSLYDKNNNNEIDLPGEYSSIDHILFSPALAAKTENASIDHNFDPLYVSDHFPVMAIIKF